VGSNGVGVGSDAGKIVAVAVAVLVGVLVAVAVGVITAVAVTTTITGVCVGATVTVGVLVGTGVPVTTTITVITTGVCVAVLVGVTVGVAVNGGTTTINPVGVGVGVPVGVAVAVGVGVPVGVAVTVGVSVAVLVAVTTVAFGGNAVDNSNPAANRAPGTNRTASATIRREKPNTHRKICIKKNEKRGSLIRDSRAFINVWPNLFNFCAYLAACPILPRFHISRSSLVRGEILHTRSITSTIASNFERNPPSRNSRAKAVTSSMFVMFSSL